VTWGHGEGKRPAVAAPISPDALARVLRGNPVRRGSIAGHRPLDDRRIGDCPIEAGPVIVDIRGSEAFRRGHIRGAVSIPIRRLPRSLFLLPPRERSLLMVGRDGSTAAEGARLLAERGRTRVTWLDGSPQDLPRDLLRPGAEANRAWEPARLLREFIARLPRTGEAIDLACGSGREAAFLALHRPRVLGVDIMPDALGQARALARAARVPPGRLALRRTDLTDARTVGVLLPPRRFRVICCFRYLDRTLLPVIARALAPGGWVIYETFLLAQARAGRTPTRSSFLLKPGELRAAFEGTGGIEIIHYAEGPDERGDHLASLVARSAASLRGPLLDAGMDTVREQ
jgi:tellurite methyltransferase